MSPHSKKQIDDSRALLNFSVPCDYEALEAFIEIMAKRYDFLSVTSIGESVLGRKIYMLSLGEHEAKGAALYVGAHHGMEWITSLILLRFVNEYCEYYMSAKNVFGLSIQSLFRERELFIVPMLNPDGADLQINGVKKDCVLYDRLMRMSGGDFSRWQANARGVDLNHNYDAGFEQYKKLEAKENIAAGRTRYSGEYPESEPESGALANFLRFNSKIRTVLTLHTQGEEIYYTSLGKVPEGAGRMAATFSRMTGYSVCVPEGLAAFGGLTDWVIKELNIPSFTLECGKGENPLRETEYYKIYAGIREMLFSASILT